MGQLRALRLVLPIAISCFCNSQNPLNADYYIPMEDKTGGGGNVGLQDVNGGPTVAQGVVGNALHYQGSQASKIGTDTRSNCFEDIEKCPDGFTVAFWLKFGSLVQKQVIDTGGYIGQSRGWTLLVMSDKIKTYTRNAGAQLATNSLCKVFQPNKWMHVAVRYNHSSANLALFLDGQKVNSDDLTESKPSGDNYRQPYIGQTVNNMLNGPNDMYLDELMHWNRPIAETTIEMIAQRTTYEVNTLIRTVKLRTTQPCDSQETFLIDEVTAPSKLKCVSICLTEMCKSLFYHPLNGSCITFTARMPRWILADVNWIFFEMK